MTNDIFITIAITGFTVAFFHAAIPTHWLPFVLTARAQKWDRAKTLWITAFAGGGHVLFTTILGALLVWLGIGISKKVGALFPLIAGGGLILFGIYYLVRQLKGGSHGHHHLLGGHAHEQSNEHGHGKNGGVLINTGHGFIEVSIFETGQLPRFRLYFYDLQMNEISPQKQIITVETLRPKREKQIFQFNPKGNYAESTSDIPEPHEFKAIVGIKHNDHAHTYETKFAEHHHDHQEHPSELDELIQGKRPHKTSDWTAISSLFILLTFSPCEGFLPVYLTGIKYGWFGFFILSLILALGTLGGMVLFTWLTLVGIEKLKLKFLEKYETGILGGLLCLLGFLVIFFEH